MRAEQPVTAGSWVFGCESRCWSHLCKVSSVSEGRERPAVIAELTWILVSDKARLTGDLPMSTASIVHCVARETCTRAPYSLLMYTGYRTCLSVPHKSHRRQASKWKWAMYGSPLALCVFTVKVLVSKRSTRSLISIAHTTCTF